MWSVVRARFAAYAAGPQRASSARRAPSWTQLELDCALYGFQRLEFRAECTPFVDVRASALKQSLFIAADALVHAGLLDGDKLGEIREGSGQIDFRS